MQRLKRLALGAVLAVATLVPLAAAQPAMSATPAQAVPVCTAIITQADSGKTIDMVIHTCDQLRLDSGLSWSQPVVSGTSVVVVPAPTATTSYQAWDILAVAPGQSTITSMGRPICAPGQVCPQFIVLFRVTINVILPPAS